MKRRLKLVFVCGSCAPTQAQVERALRQDRDVSEATGVRVTTWGGIDVNRDEFGLGVDQNAAMAAAVMAQTHAPQFKPEQVEFYVVEGLLVVKFWEWCSDVESGEVCPLPEPPGKVGESPRMSGADGGTRELVTPEWYFAENPRRLMRQVVLLIPPEARQAPRFENIIPPNEQLVGFATHPWGAIALLMPRETHDLPAQGDVDPVLFVRAEGVVKLLEDQPARVAFAFCRMETGGLVYLFVEVSSPEVEATTKAPFLVENPHWADSTVMGPLLERDRLEICFTAPGDKGPTTAFFSLIVHLPVECRSVLKREWADLIAFHRSVPEPYRNFHAAMAQFERENPINENPILNRPKSFELPSIAPSTGSSGPAEPPRRRVGELIKTWWQTRKWLQRSKGERTKSVGEVVAPCRLANGGSSREKRGDTAKAGHTDLSTQYTAAPFGEMVSGKRAELLWHDLQSLCLMREGLTTSGRSGTSVTVEGAGTLHGVSPEDIDWAIEIVAIATEGEALARKGEYAKAIEKFKTALRLAPGSDILLMNLGVVYTQMGDPPGGLPYLEEAAKTSPNNQRIQANLEQVRRLVVAGLAGGESR